MCSLVCQTFFMSYVVGSKGWKRNIAGERLQYFGFWVQIGELKFKSRGLKSARLTHNLVWHTWMFWSEVGRLNSFAFIFHSKWIKYQNKRLTDTCTIYFLNILFLHSSIYYIGSTPDFRLLGQYLLRYIEPKVQSMVHGTNYKFPTTPASRHGPQFKKPVKIIHKWNPFSCLRAIYTKSRVW
jgi:hypothetical protein